MAAKEKVAGEKGKVPSVVPKEKAEVSKEKIIDILKTVIDPELNMDVWTLGLIYEIKTAKDHVHVKMTFTTPMCPYGPMLVDSIESSIKDGIKSVKKVDVEVVFEPLWEPPEELRTMYGI